MRSYLVCSLLVASLDRWLRRQPSATDARDSASDRMDASNDCGGAGRRRGRQRWRGGSTAGSGGRGPRAAAAPAARGRHRTAARRHRRRRRRRRERADAATAAAAARPAPTASRTATRPAPIAAATAASARPAIPARERGLPVRLSGRQDLRGVQRRRRLPGHRIRMRAPHLHRRRLRQPRARPPARSDRPDHGRLQAPPVRRRRHRRRPPTTTPTCPTTATRAPTTSARPERRRTR